MLGLGAAAVAPIAAGTAVEQNAAPKEQIPAPAPPPIARGASIGEQLIAKAAQAQREKAAKQAAQQSKPQLPFHPGEGISR